MSNSIVNSVNGMHTSLLMILYKRRRVLCLGYVNTLY